MYQQSRNHRQDKSERITDLQAENGIKYYSRVKKKLIG